MKVKTQIKLSKLIFSFNDTKSSSRCLCDFVLYIRHSDAHIDFTKADIQLRRLYGVNSLISSFFFVICLPKINGSYMQTTNFSVFKGNSQVFRTFYLRNACYMIVWKQKKENCDENCKSFRIEPKDSFKIRITLVLSLTTRGMWAGKNHRRMWSSSKVISLAIANSTCLLFKCTNWKKPNLVWHQKAITVCRPYEILWAI